MSSPLALPLLSLSLSLSLSPLPPSLNTIYAVHGSLYILHQVGDLPY